MTLLLVIESLVLLGSFWWWLCSRAQQDPNMLAYLDQIIERLTKIRDLWLEIRKLETAPVVGISVTETTPEPRPA